MNRISSTYYRGGIVASTIATTSTSCSGNKNYTFKTDAEVTDYLKKHSVDVKRNHTFNESLSADYDFVADNVDFDFFINSMLWSTLVLEWGFNEPIAEDHIDLNISGDTAKIEIKHNSQEISATLKYSNQIVSFALNSPEEDDFNFTKNYDEKDHYVRGTSIDLIVYTRILVFHDSSFASSAPEETIYLSPYDWQNKQVTWNAVE